MTIDKRINALRRNLMHTLTKNIGPADAAQSMGLSGKVKIARILISRPNHRLGNLLLMTPLLQEIMETFPEAKIDLFVKGDLAPLVFKNYSNVDKIIQLPKKPFSDFFRYVQGWLTIKKNNYDIVINVINGSSSGKLSAQLANAKYRFYGDIDEAFSLKYLDHEHLAKSPVYSFRNYLGKSGFAESRQKVASMNIKLSPSELSAGKQILADLVKNDKKTICLFTNATGEKIYSPDWWEAFYERLKMEFPEYNIVEVLPVENTSQINFKAQTYFNKDVRVIGSFIANTAVFIAADSGMMHLGSAVQTPTVGLFKVTDAKSYEPYNTGSVAIDTNVSNMEEWIKVVKSVLSDQ